MKSLKDMLLWIVGLLAFVFAIWQLMLFVGHRDANGVPDMWGATNNLWLAILAAVIACSCMVAAFVRRPHVEEEIHITR